MNQGWSYREQVDQTGAGLSVLDYYTQRYRHSNREEWRSRIAVGQVQVDGKPVTPETQLQRGQWLTYDRPPWVEPEVPLDFEVLYEDADLLAIAKPAGLPVLPGGGFLEHTLLRQLQRQYPQETPLPIHRLGRGTSGLMLMARSPLARANLSHQMRQHQMRKVYRALVGNSDTSNRAQPPLADQFTITQPIGKISHSVLGYVYGATSDGLFAHSEVQVLRRDPDKTLLAVTILTGRPHQIRIHLASIGYPLLGDPLYDVGGLPRIQPQETDAKLPVPGDCGYFLHAHQLTFTHPRTGELMSLTCPPPPELA